MSGGVFTGTGGLVRLILRRDRLTSALRVPLLPVLVYSVVAGFEELLPGEAARAGYYQGTARSPAVVGMLGPVYGPGLGELTVQRVGFLCLVVPLISLLVVIRHTRAEEEAGRRELLGAAVLGRHAPLAAALLVAGAADLVTGLLAAAALLGGGLPAAGSFAFGLSLAATGWVFAAVGGVAAQLTENAGSARGVGLGVLGAAYLLRVAGDTAEASAGWLSWLSPIGWAQRVRPFAGERWWLLGVLVAVAVALVAVAVGLAGRRDVGAGILAARPGRVDASPYLRGPVGLAWRLHRGALAGWAAGFTVLGLAYGAAADAAEAALSGNPELRELLARFGGTDRAGDAFVVAVVGLLGLIAAGYTIQAVLRMRAEETALRAEPVLATAVSRTAWAAGHLVFAVLGPAVALTLGGLTTGLTYGLGTGDVARELPRVLGAALAQLPAAGVLGGLAVLLFGLAPRFTSAAWAAFAACLLLSQVGALLRLDDAVLNLSPFTHVPRLPAEDLRLAPLAWLTLVATTLTTTGLAALRHRDIPTT